MNKEFKLSKLGIDGKELGILYHQSSIKEFIRRLKEEIPSSWLDKRMEGVDINNEFFEDFCLKLRDKIDKLAGDLK